DQLPHRAARHRAAALHPDPAARRRNDVRPARRAAGSVGPAGTQSGGVTRGEIANHARSGGRGCKAPPASHSQTEPCVFFFLFAGGSRTLPFAEANKIKMQEGLGPSCNLPFLSKGRACDEGRGPCHKTGHSCTLICLKLVHEK